MAPQAPQAQEVKPRFYQARRLPVPILLLVSPLHAWVIWRPGRQYSQDNPPVRRGDEGPRFTSDIHPEMKGPDDNVSCNSDGGSRLSRLLNEACLPLVAWGQGHGRGVSPSCFGTCVSRPRLTRVFAYERHTARGLAIWTCLSEVAQILWRASCRFDADARAAAKTDCTDWVHASYGVPVLVPTYDWAQQSAG